MFGDCVRQLRLARNMSQVDIALQLHISKQTVSNWENNNIMPSVEMLMQLADLFMVTTDYLLERDTRNFLEVTGLDETQLAHICLLIDDLRSSPKTSGCTADSDTFCTHIPKAYV